MFLFSASFESLFNPFYGRIPITSAEFKIIDSQSQSAFFLKLCLSQDGVLHWAYLLFFRKELQTLHLLFYSRLLGKGIGR